MDLASTFFLSVRNFILAWEGRTVGQAGTWRIGVGVGVIGATRRHPAPHRFKGDAGYRLLIRLRANLLDIGSDLPELA